MTSSPWYLGRYDIIKLSEGGVQLHVLSTSPHPTSTKLQLKIQKVQCFETQALTLSRISSFFCHNALIFYHCQVCQCHFTQNDNQTSLENKSLQQQKKLS